MDLTHHFLLSMPTLADSWFDKSITYIFEHSESGAIGFVINRHTHMVAGDIYDQLKIECNNKHSRAIPVFQGGPVDGERGFILCDSNTLPAATDDAGSATVDAVKVNAANVAETSEATDPTDVPAGVDSYNINPFGIGVSSSVGMLTELGAQQGPAAHLLLLGYAGWAPGQLEAEIAGNSWLTCEATADIIFHDDSDEKFTMAAKSIGIDFSLLSGDAGHA